MTKRLWWITALTAIVGCHASEPAADEGRVRLELDRFVAPNGKEGLKCQTFANPRDEPMDVVSWAADLDETGHHLLAFLVEGSEDEALHDCAGVDDAVSLAFQSQASGTSTLEYPEGVAIRIEPDQALQVQIHWLNPTEDPVEVTNALELELAEPGSVGQTLGEIHFDNFDIEVPIGGQATTSKTCTLDRDVDLVWLTSHMHYRGVAFEARVDGEPIYQSLGWDDPPTGVWDPPIRVDAGHEISFSCSYDNWTDHVLRFGPSLENDEMCVLVGAYLPVGADDNTRIDCTGTPDGCLACGEALMGGDPTQLCTEARDAWDQVKACTCGDGPCGEACAGTACMGGPPDDACLACSQASCAEPLAACFS